MTLPTKTPINRVDDDSDIFGPPRSTSFEYYHQRSRVPMISPKLRLREERKRILQLCAHKLERIKDSETNLRRSVCINNTYSRLTDELRREKQSRYLIKSSKSKITSTMYHDNTFNVYNRWNDHFHQNHGPHFQQKQAMSIINPSTGAKPPKVTLIQNHYNENTTPLSSKFSISSLSSSNEFTTCYVNNVDTNLELLDRELSAINESMPLIDPEITQGAEQLEKAILSRKHLRNEEEHDRFVREALSQLYIPAQRLILGIDDSPVDNKRMKLSSNINNNCNNVISYNNILYNRNTIATGTKLDLELSLDYNQSQKDLEKIMDALRFGTNNPTSTTNDSCGQTAMLSKSKVFHSLVVATLET